MGRSQRRGRTRLLVAALPLAVLVVLVVVGPAEARHTRRYPYRAVDLGTLGGPQADVGNGPYLGLHGVVTGTADTGLLDPYGSKDSGAFNGDRFVQHTYLWHNGVLSDLGALGPVPAHNSSYPNGINVHGDLAGISDTGAMDPLIGTAAADAVLWKRGQIINLGTLGGNESQAFSLNDRDQVTGVAANAIRDPFSMLPWGTQARAFLWQNGKMRDLGTLGGPDSFGWFVNDRGEIVGVSYTSATPNRVTGQPPSDVFLWQNGRMRNLGSLGGSVPTFGGVTALNSGGEIVGQSDLNGDKIAHPFLWNGKRMTDLGTFGGKLGSANAVNSVGQVVGWANTIKKQKPPLGEPGDQVYQAFLWSHGRMTNLGTAPGDKCSVANSVNDLGQIVGSSGKCHGGIDAFLYEHGSIINLNTVVAPTRMHLTEALTIDDRGEIVGIGVLPNGAMHNFLLIPNRG